MPVYSYACRSCDNKFDEIKKVDERNTPTDSPCVSCGGELYIHIGGSLGYVDNTGRLNQKKVPQDFQNLVSGIMKTHKQEYKG